MDNPNKSLPKDKYLIIYFSHRSLCTITKETLNLKLEIDSGAYLHSVMAHSEKEALHLTRIHFMIDFSLTDKQIDYLLFYSKVFKVES